MSKLREGSPTEPGPSRPSGVRVIAITGRPGVGKTTLAKYVYNYVREENTSLFDIFMWVYAPRNFKAGDVISKMMKVMESKEEILGNLTEQRVQHSLDENFPLEGFRLDINRMLRSKNCLLVLDNFGCTEVDWEQWQNFTSCLSSWGSGSKILLTTPSTEALRQIRVPEENIYKLEQLEEGSFFKLFMYHASDNDSNTQEDSLEEVGREIAKKLKGDPKAAEVAGAQLREKGEITEWEKLSKNDWSGYEIMKSRVWSYQSLHPHLQRCFAFCGLFPKGFRFRGDMLIHLWMAEGFIKPANNGTRMEDIGKSYMDQLVSRYFLDERVDEEGNQYCALHDLLHDLAKQVCSDDCIKIEYNNNGEIPREIKNKLSQKKNIRHISLQAGMINEVINDICKQEDLRTLIIFEGDRTVSEEELEEILKCCEKLRVLSLPSCRIKDLPNSIGNLKHLRYLDISGCSLRKLPKSICKLYHLQVFVLSSCKSLPRAFSELISLRHFLTSNETASKICNVGRLTSIQGLSEFNVQHISSHT